MDLTAFPTTILEFEARFGDERACWEYLWHAKWPNGFACPKCKGTKAYYVIERALEQCASCKHQASVTAGTMFHRTRTPLRKWFRAIFEFVSRKHGSGTYVTHRPALPNDLGRNLSVSSLIRSTGMEPGTEEQTSGAVPAPAAVAEALGIEEGEPVSCLRRVRTADGRRVVDVTDWCRTDHLAPEELPDLPGGSIYAALAHYVHPATHLRRGRWFERSAIWMALVARHAKHHKEQRVNFNVVLPIGDLIFGTLARAR